VLTSKPAGQCLCRGLRAVAAQVSQQDMLARTDPTRNRLADRSRSNNARSSDLDHHLEGLPRVHRTVAIGHTVDIRDAMLKAE